MISRKAALHVQNLYYTLFCEISEFMFGAYLHKDRLYDFLYENDFEGWFLDLYQRQVKTSEDLRHFILNLHTGMAYVSKHQTLSDKKAIGQSMIKRLATSVLKMLEPDFNSPTAGNNPDVVLGKALVNRLALDGYLYKNGQLFPIQSSVVDEQEEQSVLEQLINRLNLSDSALVKHHLELAETAYLESRWNDTISNARNFLEAILSQVASALHLRLQNSQLNTHRPVDIRDYLASAGLINETEKQAIAKIYGLISNTGSHPNIAAEDEARLMRNLALTFSQYILLQWDGYLRNNP
jgi:hypothetical protein